MARLRVRELAEAQGLDIAKLARRADLGYGTVHSLWNETTESPGLKTLTAIARVLGVRTGDLIADEVEESRQEQPTNKKVPALVAVY
jgi:transcriptional regulator with XRE-family HTH domain